MGERVDVLPLHCSATGERALSFTGGRLVQFGVGRFSV